MNRIKNYQANKQTFQSSRMIKALKVFDFHESKARYFLQHIVVPLGKFIQWRSSLIATCDYYNVELFPLKSIITKYNHIYKMIQHLTFHGYPVQIDLNVFTQPFRLILAAIRLIPSAAILCFLILFQDYVRPHIMVIPIRRYISCIVNLICIRFILLLMGCIRFECENFKYFTRGSKILTFKSGWIGVASHKTIIDFLYFTYLFNPVYVKVIEYKLEDTSTIFYSPMTFKQAFFAALSYRGFDPIVVRSQLEFKRLKKRKMRIQTIISECFEDLYGPILIMQPGIGSNQQLKMNAQIGKDIFENQRRFLRSGLVFVSEINIDEARRYSEKNRNMVPYLQNIYPNQLHLLYHICSEFRNNKLSITAYQLIKRKLEYRNNTICIFIDEYYSNSGLRILDQSFQEYLEEADELEEKIKTVQEEREQQNQMKRKKKQKQL